MNLLQSFQSFITKENLFSRNDKLLLAVSGGIDSVVLSELCKQAGYDFEIAHCNFTLRGIESDRDEQFVKQLAEKYLVPFHLNRFDTVAESKIKKASIETTARELRYSWFDELLRINNSTPNTQHLKHILTAHHANDNVETLLMNFFRGSGVKGLHGILPKQGNIIRPLLFAKKETLLSFAVDCRLEFVTDHTNAENEYTRNYFRNELIPSIKKVFPGVEDNLLFNIERFKEVEILYRQSIALHKSKLLEVKGNEIYIAALKLLKAKPLATIVYEIIKDFGFTAKQTPEVIGLLQANSGKYINSSTHRILKNRKHLVITSLQEPHALTILVEATDQNVSFENGNIKVEFIESANATLTSDPSVAMVSGMEIKFPLILRKWKQGDYFYPLGMDKKKKLSRFFIDQKLSLVEKENTWVLETDKKILWVIGMRIDNRFRVKPSTNRILKLTLKRVGE